MSCRPASKDNISGCVLCNSKASSCFLFLEPGSLVCLLPSQSVCLAGLPPRLIYAERLRAKRWLKWTTTEGFFHKIVFHWCYTLTSAEPCIHDLPSPPLQCFSVFNTTERTPVLSCEGGGLWGAVPSLVPAQRGPPMPGRTLCFPEHPCWEGICL